MCRVIVNSTPLISLGRINRLDLLKKVYGTICIPQAVYDEICEKDDAASALLKTDPAWIKVAEIKDETALRWFPVSLHDGEVEVMILADEMGGKQVVIDDLPARKHAIRLFGREKVLGTLGTLIIAKRMGVNDEVGPIIDDLKRTGIRYSDAAIQTALRMAGE